MVFRVLNILVVEDTKIAQVIIKSQLLKNNCTVDIADDGLSALEMSKKTLYDLILMDIGLGDGPDGFEVTQHIKNEENLNQHTPIVAISAHDEPKYIEKALTVGMERYFTKPLTPVYTKELLDVVKQIKTHQLSSIVKQRAKLTPLEGKTASKIDPPESDNLPAR